MVGVAPHLEGMTFNGELLASVPSTVAIALAVFWWRRSKSLWWLAGSGLLAGVALTMKQSGIDGIVVGLVIVAIATRAFRRGGPSPAGDGTSPSRADVADSSVLSDGAGGPAAIAGGADALTDTRVLGMRPPDPSTVGGPGGVGVRKAGAVFVGAVAVPLIASVLHGIAVGWSYYWTALIGYQLNAMGGEGSNTSTRLTDLGRHAGDIALDLTLVLVISFFAWRLFDRDTRWLFGAWLLAGFIGINLGGSYWPHYFVQPLPALVLMAAITVVAVAGQALAARALRRGGAAHGGVVRRGRDRCRRLGAGQDHPVRGPGRSATISSPP